MGLRRTSVAPPLSRPSVQFEMYEMLSESVLMVWSESKEQTSAVSNCGGTDSASDIEELMSGDRTVMNGGLLGMVEEEGRVRRPGVRTKQAPACSEPPRGPQKTHSAQSCQTLLIRSPNEKPQVRFT